MARRVVARRDVVQVLSRDRSGRDDTDERRSRWIGDEIRRGALAAAATAGTSRGEWVRWAPGVAAGDVRRGASWAIRRRRRCGASEEDSVATATPAPFPHTFLTVTPANPDLSRTPSPFPPSVHPIYSNDANRTFIVSIVSLSARASPATVIVVVAGVPKMNTRAFPQPHLTALRTSSPPPPSAVLPRLSARTFPSQARAGAVRAAAVAGGDGQAHDRTAAASPAAGEREGVSGGAAGLSAEAGSGSGETKTCRRYHPALFTGGERGKAVGFTRASSRPEDQLSVVHGTGLLRFWDCCGAVDVDAPGCTCGPHASFDEFD
ncbi:unnamed protein product [Closterium sp. Naga37s-1]|nr:unnamed protein product [Closterium sp. Naga37s-1]